MRWTQKLMREVACEEREGLGLGPLDPFDPYELCREHGIPVYSITTLAEHLPSTAAVQYFTGKRASAWSAALVPLDKARMIIENDSHAPVRRRSNIAHELGHHLLEHEFHEVVLGEDHTRQFSADQEKQANFMAGELLIPLRAAERMAFDDRDNAYVSERYGVSLQFAQMQMKGQRVRAGRAASGFARR